MSHECDRRTFLRRVGCVGLVAPSFSLACASGDRPAAGGAPDGPDDDGSSTALDPVTRPVLRPWSNGAVHILSPLDEMPMAYVSMGRREVFVDHAFRDRSNWILEAHISVSTGLWRIPLPGDPVGQPITPGDTIREFEELDIAEWDPTMEPAEGDFRIRRGRPAPVRVDFACVPMSPTSDWFSGGPWDIRRCDGVGEEACREDFVEIGIGSRQPIRGCEDPAVPARFFTWACRG